MKALAPLAALFAAHLVVAPSPAAAATLIVGPAEAITRIADAARLAKDGDTVLIRPGTYKADVAVWPQKALEIRGYGGRPVLSADGRSADGKAIWVFPNGHFKVENIEFRGARVADGNGAGIRFEQGSLEVRDCVFEDNQNGILTANVDSAELRVFDSRFSQAPREAGTLHHLLYVGNIKTFVLEGSRFHQGYLGHLVKSRAARSEVRYNLLVDGSGGMASYELEFPNGGVAVVVGNVIAQSATSPNPIVVAYGAEGSRWPENRLLMAHNTLINTGWRPAWFTRAWSDKLPADAQIVTRNNLTVGLGGFSVALPGDHRGNFPLPGGAMDPDSLDFMPPDLLRGRVAPPDGPLGELLTPRAEFALPIGTLPLTPPGAWSPGAFQSHGMVTRQPAGR